MSYADGIFIMPDGEFERERWRGSIEQRVRDHDNDLQDLRSAVRQLRDSTSEVNRQLGLLQSIVSEANETVKQNVRRAAEQRDREIEELKASIEIAAAGRRVTRSDVVRTLAFPLTVAVFTILLLVLQGHLH